MPIGELNAFVYGIHAELDQLKRWSTQAHGAIEDHAQRLDALRVGAIRGLQQELAMTQDDAEKALQMIDKNDTEMKAIISSVMGEISNEMVELKKSSASLSENMDRRYARSKRLWAPWAQEQLQQRRPQRQAPTKGLLGTTMFSATALRGFRRP